ncbi:MAG: hypothetical protein JRC92_07665 [Deltaproteobacteria bacterium]|nr:hypothetical protein [Deltaproteobacteria bacterium]
MRPQRRLFLLVLIAALASAGVWLAWSVTAAHRQEENLTRVTKSAPPPSLGKEEIAFLIGQPVLEPGGLDGLTLRAGEGRAFLVESTLDPDLQDFLANLVSRAQAPVAAAVVLEPASGRVLALASFNRLGKETNYALSPAFPAASIIKIVTVAAAMEGAGLTPSSLIPYNGRPYTLYRSQLRERKTRWTRQPTLAESFARSLNPVFGKLALKPIGSAGMKEFVHRFGFNQTLRFELPLAPSRVEVPRDNTFALATIGCGFNRNTTLSPLHGAMLAAAVVNDGVMMEPTIIERISLLDDGRPVREVYQSRPQIFREVVSPQTAQAMRRMMRATITKGTARRSFKGHSRDRVLGRLEIGGKTGSLNDITQTYRVDWFVGYARDEAGHKTLALAVMVAHDLKRRGISSRQLARQTIRFYFNDRTASQTVAQKPIAAPETAPQAHSAASNPSPKPEDSLSRKPPAKRRRR